MVWPLFLVRRRLSHSGFRVFLEPNRDAAEAMRRCHQDYIMHGTGLMPLNVSQWRMRWVSDKANVLAMVAWRRSSWIQRSSAWAISASPDDKGRVNAKKIRTIFESIARSTARPDRDAQTQYVAATPARQQGLTQDSLGGSLPTLLGVLMALGLFCLQGAFFYATTHSVALNVIGTVLLAGSISMCVWLTRDTKK